MKIALITDAWEPQVNGVVRTWSHVRLELEKLGHEFLVIHPGLFRTVRAPRYPEIRLAIMPGRKVCRLLNEYDADTIHIATEGPLGKAARRYCVTRKLPFTTSYHTQFPQYLKKYYGIPMSLTYRFVRWCHGRAEATLAPTARVKQQLNEHGLNNVEVWGRGVDTAVFKPDEGDFFDLPRPIFLNAGRVAIEKNIEAFLELELPGSKVVVGDGPAKAALERKYPDVHWPGYKFGDDLARHYAGADVFVFPSKTDTFGVVMLEANGCGLPVAAYPVTGPVDVVQEGRTGCLNEDLRQACLDALEVSPDDCIAYAKANSWHACAMTALGHMAAMKPTAAAAHSADATNQDDTGQPVIEPAATAEVALETAGPTK